MIRTISSKWASLCQSHDARPSASQRRVKTLGASSQVSFPPSSELTRRGASSALTLFPRCFNPFFAFTCTHLLIAPFTDDRTRCAARLVHVQPALRRAAGAHRRDIDGGTMRIQSSVRHGASLAVDLRRVHPLAARPAYTVQAPARLFRRLPD